MKTAITNFILTCVILVFGPGCVWTDLATKAGTLSGLSGITATPTSEASVMQAAGYKQERVVRYKDVVCDPSDITLTIGWGKVLVGEAAIAEIVASPSVPVTISTQITDSVTAPALSKDEQNVDRLTAAVEALAEKKSKK